MEANTNHTTSPTLRLKMASSATPIQGAEPARSPLDVVQLHRRLAYSARDLANLPLDQMPAVMDDADILKVNNAMDIIEAAVAKIHVRAPARQGFGAPITVNKAFQDISRPAPFLSQGYDLSPEDVPKLALQPPVPIPTRWKKLPCDYPTFEPLHGSSWDNPFWNLTDKWLQASGIPVIKLRQEGDSNFDEDDYNEWDEYNYFVPDFAKIYPVPQTPALVKERQGDISEADEQFFLSPRAALRLYLALTENVGDCTSDLYEKYSQSYLGVCSDLRELLPGCDLQDWSVELRLAYDRVKNRLVKGALMTSPNHDANGFFMEAGEDLPWVLYSDVGMKDPNEALWTRAGFRRLRNTNIAFPLFKANRGYGAHNNMNVLLSAFPGNPNCMAEVHLIMACVKQQNTTGIFEDIVANGGAIGALFDSLPKTRYDDISAWPGDGEGGYFEVGSAEVPALRPLGRCRDEPTSMGDSKCQFLGSSQDPHQDPWQNWFVPFDAGRLEDHYLPVCWKAQLHKYFPPHFRHVVFLAVSLASSSRTAPGSSASPGSDPASATASKETPFRAMPRLPVEIWQMILGLLVSDDIVDSNVASRGIQWQLKWRQHWAAIDVPTRDRLAKEDSQTRERLIEAKKHQMIAENQRISESIARLKALKTPAHL